MAGKTKQECIDRMYDVIARAHWELCQERRSDNQESPQMPISQTGATSTREAESARRRVTRGNTRTMPTTSANTA